MSAALDRSARIEAALVELLRLYDWRNELGRKERDFNHDRKQMKTWLNQYGREKKAAWAVAREVLASREIFPTFAGTVCEGMQNVMQQGTAGCQHEWRGPGPKPGRYTCGCGTHIFTTHADAE